MGSRVCSECSAAIAADAYHCPRCGLAVDPTEVVSEPPKLPGAAGGSLDLGPGSVFAGRFTIVERVGSGGMGVVYKAIDRTLDTEVALKLIRPEVAASPDLVNRFKREVRVTRKITHPSVCRVHDIGESGGLFFLSMEWVEGETLVQLIRQAGKLTERRAIAIAERIARALEVAHAEGVIHRDLKPANVMLDARGQVRVMDFGLAHEQGSSRISRTGAVVGTPFYMAPEQRRGRKVDPRTDLYALGLILREMLTGLRLDSEGDHPDPIELGVSPVVAPVVRTLLEEDPDDRCASATEARAALREMLDSQAIPSIGVFDTPGKSAPASRRRLGVWAAAAVVVVTGLVAAWWALGPSTPEGELPEEAAFHFDRGVRFLHEDTDSPRTLGDAIASLHRARRAAPDAAIVLARLGEAYWTRVLVFGVEEARHEAESLVAEAIEIDPDLPEVLHARALGRIAEADYESALADLEKAVAEKPGLFEAWTRLGSVHQQLGSYAAARAAYERAIELQPDRSSLRVYLGVLCEDLGEHDEAIEHYRDAVELAPDNVQAVNNLGTACLMTGRYDEAVRVYRRSIEIEETATAVSNLGTSSYLLGDYRAAIQQYDRATMLEPEQPVHWGNLGDARMMLGDEVRAREAFERAAELAELRSREADDDPHALAQLALYCAKAHREPCAIANGAKAADLQPDNPRFLRINAVIHAMFGRTRDGIDYLEQAVKLGCTKAEIDATPELAVLREHPRYASIYASAD